MRAKLGAEETLFASIERAQEAFGFTEDVSDEAIRHSAELPVDAIVGANRAGSPGMTIRSGTRDNNKVLFLLCRSMGEYLINGMQPQQIISGSRSARQKRNRAFAAEFLAPAALLRRRIRGYSVSLEEVEELGVEFGVSGMVIAHQLENHRIAIVNAL